MIGTIPAENWKCCACNVRLAQRLLRFMVYNLIPLPNGQIFVTFAKRLGILDGKKFITLSGINKPFRVLRGGVCLGADGSLYFGEYFRNMELDEVYIYRFNQKKYRIEIAYSMKPGYVRHIHGIYNDPFTNSIFVTCGDKAHECRILKTDDFFETVEVVGEGDETWRAVSLQFTENSIYYGTDAEFRSNYIYKVDRKTNKRKNLGTVTGPIYYSTRIADNLLFGVTAELSPSQMEPKGSIFCVDKEDKLRKLVSYTKDLGANKITTYYFMFGTMHFPYVSYPTNEIYVHGVGLKGLDNCNIRIYETEQQN